MPLTVVGTAYLPDLDGSGKTISEGHQGRQGHQGRRTPSLVSFVPQRTRGSASGAAAGTLAGLRRKAQRTAARRRRVIPKVATMVAPVGRSRTKERATPPAETRAPMPQPIARRTPKRSEKSMAATEGTIRKQKTRSTPATATDEVTTKPNET